jgi:hypothetical protein
MLLPPFTCDLPPTRPKKTYDKTISLQAEFGLDVSPYPLLLLAFLTIAALDIMYLLSTLSDIHL